MSYRNYYPWINAGQINNTNFAGDANVGAGLTLARNNLRPATFRNQYPNPEKNYLRAAIVWLDPNNVWHVNSWPRIYASGWNSLANPNIYTAGDVVLGKGNGSRVNFDNNINGNWRTMYWPSLLGGPQFVYGNYRSFAAFNAHTEQTFFYDARSGSRPTAMSNGIVPKKAMLYLFSSRDPCPVCQRTLNLCVNYLAGFPNDFISITFNILPGQAATVDFRLFMDHLENLNILYSSTPVNLTNVPVRLFLTVVQLVQSIQPEKDEDSKETKDATQLIDNDDDNKKTHVGGDKKSVHIDGMEPKLPIEADSLVSDSKQNLNKNLMQ